MPKPYSKRRASIIMAEVVAAIAVTYFLLGGDTWNPKIWAVFTIVAIMIVVINLHKETG